VGSGEFLNLTKGLFPELLFDLVRNVGFSGDGAHVWFRVTVKESFRSSLRSSVWVVPTMGGVARPFLPSALEAAWSPDHARMLYYAPEPGDPIFVADPNGGNAGQICIDKPGVHEHYLAWSPDGSFAYFVKGFLPPTYDMDIWRVRSTGGAPERLTNHHSRVTSPTFLDGRTLIYTATRDDGSGSGLYGIDVEHRIPHALNSGLEEYLDVSASSDGRRLAATVANPTRDIWTVPITDHVVDDSAAARFRLPTVRASKPRFGADYLLYLGSKGGAAGLWKFKAGSETELWNGGEGAVVVAPAISPDGAQICVAIRREGKSSLFVMSADGTSMHRLAEGLDVADAPSWSPDGKWIAVVANEGKANPLYKVPIDGKEPVRLVEGVNFDPVWSPDGRFILYSESRGGASHRLRGVTPDKQPYPLPEVWVRYAGNRCRFLSDGKTLVIVQGGLRSQNFWLLDLGTGRLRQLTNLRPGFDTKTFDVSPDGKTILFDRYRENSDIVLIDLPPR
jgi:Tol biopolymer transport system component